ncbi:hypothetical protein BH18ACT5_BH18ACT5_18820 [soil metagenome]
MSNTATNPGFAGNTLEGVRRWIPALLVILACGNEVALDTPWDRRARMDVPRSEMPAVVLNDQVWVLGGLTNSVLGVSGSRVVEVYDPATDTWSAGPDLPEGRHHVMAAVVGEDLYLIGGMIEDSFTPSDLAWRLRAGVWEEIASLPAPRAAGAAVAAGDSIYVIGGVPDGASVLRFDVVTGEWSETAPLAVAREHTAAAFYGGRIYVAGGRWNGEMLSSVEGFDARSRQWSAGPDLLEARSGFALVGFDDGLVALGGEVFDPTNSLASVEVLAGEQWQPGPVLPEGLHGVPAAVVDGTVYVLVGSRRAGDVDNAGDVWALDVNDL